jgi:hypothetical protein
VGREVVELLLSRKRAVPKQVHDLLEGGVLGQVVNVVAPIDELALVAVDGREFGFKGNHAFEPSRFDGGIVRR